MDGMRMTRAGLNYLARAISGETLTFTKVKLGDAMKNGTLKEPTPEEILDMNSLIHAVNLTVPIVDVKFGGNGTCVVSAQVDNTDLAAGFFAREVGLFAKIGSDAEILYAYKNDGALGSYIAAGGGDTVYKVVLNIVTIIAEAANVTAVIDGSVQWLTRAELTEHINSTNPHPNFLRVLGDVTTSSHFWATGSDIQLHRISAADLTKQLLGDNITALTGLNSRVNQNEINIANLFMLLDAQKNLGMEANLLLAEDFEDCTAIDMFKVKVTAVTKGTNTFTVEELTGITVGRYYTLSDGTRSQLIKVVSVIKDAACTVTASANITKSFTVKKTYLYRSTCRIENHKVGGAGDVRTRTFYFGDLWTGESTAADSNLALTTTQQNAGNFTLSGDYGFTSDGYFTLK